MNSALTIENVIERTGGSKSSLLTLQLMAWRKLDLKGHWSGPSFAELVEQKGSRFRAYGLIAAASAAYDWFDVEEKSLESLSSKDLALIIDVVAKCDLLKIEYDVLVGLINRGPRKHSGDIFLPNAVASLMMSLCNIAPTDSVLCLFENAISLGFKAAEYSNDVTVGDTDNDSLVHLSNILLDRNVKISEGGKGEPFSTKYNIVLYAPSFEESDWVGRVVYAIEGLQGRAAILVANSFLYRTTLHEFELKSDLINDNMIDLIVSMPKSLFPSNSPQSAFIVFDMNRTESDVVFGDFKKWMDTQHGDVSQISISEFARMLRDRNATHNSIIRVPRNKLIDNQCNIAPDRYFLSSRQKEVTQILNRLETQPLEKLVELIRPRSFRGFESEHGEDFFEVSVGDISDDGLVRPPSESTIRLDPTFKAKFPHILLCDGDILFPIKGSIGRVGLVRDRGSNDNWETVVGNLIVNQSIIVMRPRSYNISLSVYLQKYLTSAIGRACIDSIRKGASVPYLQIADIKRIPVPVISDEAQHQIFRLHDRILERYASIDEIKTEIERFQTKIEDLFLQ